MEEKISVKPDSTAKQLSWKVSVKERPNSESELNGHKSSSSSPQSQRSTGSKK